MEVKKSVAIMFTNWTEEDFSHMWDSVQYTFKSGESTYLQDYLAKHFAKHLAQREINKLNLPMTDKRYEEFYNKCLVGKSIEAETDLKLEMKMKLDEIPYEPKTADFVCDICGFKSRTKAGLVGHKRYKHGKEKSKISKIEDTFEGLK